MRLIWSPEARRVLIEIRDDATLHTSQVRAIAEIERIRERVLLLLVTPRAGRRVAPELRDELRVIAVRPRWIYYRIGAELIEVVSIKHYRRDDALRPD